MGVPQKQGRSFRQAPIHAPPQQATGLIAGQKFTIIPYVRLLIPSNAFYSIIHNENRSAVPFEANVDLRTVLTE